MAVDPFLIKFVYIWEIVSRELICLIYLFAWFIWFVFRSELYCFDKEILQGEIKAYSW